LVELVLAHLLAVQLLSTRSSCNIRAIRDRKLHQRQNAIQDSNADFRINLDPDRNICRIGPKMLWIHSIVGVSHFAKYNKNQPLIV